MSFPFPRWFWWILGVVLIIIICVVLKINVNLGSSGFSITQGIIH